MPPAVIAIAAAVATWAVSTYVASAILAAILIIAINVAATFLTRRPNAQRTISGQEVRLKLDPAMPRQLVLGQTATGGSMVWAFTYGSSSKIPSGLYLVRIIALSDLPIEGVVRVMNGKQQLTFSGDIHTGLRTCTNAFLTKGGAPCMEVQVYKGSPTPTADANLVSWSGGQWTSNHKGINTAYAILRYKYDFEGEAFPSGEPQLVWVCQGVKCYDDRKDGTKPSRVGTHRVNDPTTWEYTENSANLIAQVLRGFYSNNVLIVGAQAEERDLSDPMLISAYNTCDELVTYSGGTQKRYTSGIMCNSGDPVANLLMELQSSMDGRIIDRGGAITILPGATRTPVFNLTDADIIWSAQKSWQPKATLSELYNHVNGVYVDEENNYQEKAFPPQRNTTWETDDGGERLTQQVGWSAVTNWARAQRIAKRIHQASRFQGTVAFVLPLWAIEMEQGDWFTIASARWDFTTKYFEAITVDIDPSLNVIVIGRETSATIDGWNHVVDERARTDTFWNAPAFQLPIPAFTATAAYEQSAQGIETFGVLLEITNLGVERGSATLVDFELAPTADLANIKLLGTVPALDQKVQFFGLLPGVGYSIRARSTDGSTYSTRSSWVAFTTSGSANGFAVVVTSPVVVLVDAAQTPVAGQLPKNIVVDVMRGATSVKLSNDTSYSITNSGVTATIDNTNGSSTKGNISLTAIAAPSGYIDITVTYQGLPVTPARVTITKQTQPAGGGGGVGSKEVTVSGNTSVVSVDPSFEVLSNTGTLTLATGESLYGTGSVGYDYTRYAGPVTRAVRGKWQYSVHLANSWSDFGVFATGTLANGDTGQPGDLSALQTKSGLAAGDYDVRYVVALTSALTGGSSMQAYSYYLHVEAKV